MIEIINTSTRILELEKEGIFAEISMVEKPERVEVELYVFRKHPEKDRMLLLRCIGNPERKYGYLGEIFALLKNPEEWLKRYNEDE